MPPRAMSAPMTSDNSMHAIDEDDTQLVAAETPHGRGQVGRPKRAGKTSQVAGDALLASHHRKPARLLRRPRGAARGHLLDEVVEQFVGRQRRPARAIGRDKPRLENERSDEQRHLERPRAHIHARYFVETRRRLNAVPRQRVPQRCAGGIVLARVELNGANGQRLRRLDIRHVVVNEE